MKKLLLATVAMALTAVSSFAQGTVIFANSSTTLITFGTGGDGVAGTPVPTGSRFMVELYYAPGGAGSADPGDAGMMQGSMGPAINIAAIPPTGGRYNGGTRTTPVSTGPGINAWFQVRAWESAFGNTYEAARDAAVRDVGGQMRGSYLGTSGRFNIVTGVTTPTPISNPGGVNAFSVNAVPEPSTIALGIVGGLATMVLLRRRK